MSFQMPSLTGQFCQMESVLPGGGGGGGEGVLDVSLAGEVRRGPSYPDPV